MTILLRTDGR